MICRDTFFKSIILTAQITWKRLGILELESNMVRGKIALNDISTFPKKSDLFFN